MKNFLSVRLKKIPTITKALVKDVKDLHQMWHEI